MSDWKTHLRIGLITEILIVALLIGASLYNGTPLDYKELLLLIPLLFVSPLLPDIDHKSSKITTIGVLVSVLAVWIFYYYNIDFLVIPLIAASVILLFSNFTKHRGITHRWWFYSIIYIILLLTTNMFILTITSFSGVLSHLVLDKELF
jgi:hypothetical protein